MSCNKLGNRQAYSIISDFKKNPQAFSLGDENLKLLFITWLF